MSTAAAPSDVNDPAAAAAAAAAAAQFAFAVDNVVTPVLIATFIACLLYGILLYLAAAYFTRFGSTDRLAFKLLVGFLTLSALADTMVDCAWAWTYTVNAFTDPTVLAVFPWTFTAYAVLAGPNVFLAQGFFTWRVWIISNRKNWWLPSIMLLLELTACALSWYLAYWVDQATYMTEFVGVKGIMYAWLASGLLCDILITSAIVYYLLIRPRRLAGAAGEAKLTRSNPLGHIIIKSFQINAASLVVQTLVLVIIIAKGTTVWYSVPGFQESKIYIISVIATLNARHSTSPDDSAEFTHSYGASSRRNHSSSKARSAAFSRNGQASVPVHVTISEEVKVDEGASEFSRDLRLDAAAPYAVRFERAAEGDGGDVELGKKASYGNERY
ncbi:hypothetical protein JCM10450v2_008300 [Rhodotorula kratochvilovae]